MTGGTRAISARSDQVKRTDLAAPHHPLVTGHKDLGVLRKAVGSAGRRELQHSADELVEEGQGHGQ